MRYGILVGASVLGIMTPAIVSAEKAPVNLGVLTCTFVKPAQDTAQKMTCGFKPAGSGAEENYSGRIRESGQDLPAGKVVLIWAVLGPAAKQPDVQIVAVANRTRESSRRVADEFAIAKVHDHWQALLEDASIDAVCIGTWPYMHAPLTIAALEAGKHVLCEARMAMDHGEARAMLAALLRHPALTAQIVPAPHTLAFDRTIVEIIVGGYIGELISIDARIAAARSYPDGSAPQYWHQDRVFSGDNIMSMGIWYEAMMRWVGPAKSVMAVGQSVVRHRHDPSGRRVPMEIPDHVDIIGAMAQGGQMRFNVSAVLGHAPNVADVHIFGTDGTIRLRQPVGGAMALFAGKRGKAELDQVEIDPAKRGGWRVEEEFVNAIRGKERITHTDFSTGVKYMEWTTAVSRSLRQRQAVMLPL